ncbi:hypothetical protein DL770_006777 [Monosporascus sp. CRB-9-2]|nr:hypothetical protein DL770_006777 [Monosporascus sp. CRB-9-2]
MASIAPIAGAQYHWTYHVVPPRMRRFAAWIQAWSTWARIPRAVTGMANATIIQLGSTVQLNHEGYIPRRLAYVSFDAIVHMSEEARKAESAVPRAMFWSIFANDVLAFLIVAMILSAMAYWRSIGLRQKIGGSNRLFSSSITRLCIYPYEICQVSLAWERPGIFRVEDDAEDIKCFFLKLDRRNCDLSWVLTSLLATTSSVTIAGSATPLDFVFCLT